MPEHLEAVIVGGGALISTIGTAHMLYKTRRSRIQITVCWLGCLFTSMLLGLILHRAAGSYKELPASLILIAAYFYLFEAPVWQLIFIFLGVNTFILAAASSAGYLVTVLEAVWPGLSDIFVFTALFFVLSFIAQRAFGKMMRRQVMRLSGPVQRHFYGIAIFAGVGYVLMLLQCETCNDRLAVSAMNNVSQDLMGSGGRIQNFNFADVANLILLLLLLCLGYFLAFSNMTTAWEMDEARKKTERMSEELRQSEKYYQTLTAHQQKIRRLEHDMRHHFRVLEACVRNGETGRMENYLKALMDSTPEADGPAFCANYTAAILLGYYAGKASEAGIRFKCDAQIPSELPIQDSHLSIVLGNALQNALEACRSHPSGDTPFIELLARARNGFLTLEIKNSFDGSLLYDRQGHIKSRKSESGHGLGLSSVADIAQLYNGYYSAKPEGNMFILRVVHGARKSCQ